MSESFPRARGDVPSIPDNVLENTWFSPRTRGCSFALKNLADQALVFPAHTGMFRGTPARVTVCRGFPRARGDVPGKCPVEDKGSTFSPRTRGCSAIFSTPPGWSLVFPAHAGMFLSIKRFPLSTFCFPRARGDVPQ